MHHAKIKAAAKLQATNLVAYLAISAATGLKYRISLSFETIILFHSTLSKDHCSLVDQSDLLTIWTWQFRKPSETGDWR